MFIVQGEGRGHLTQAISLAAMLQRHGHEVAETLVGKSQAREVPDFWAVVAGRAGCLVPSSRVVLAGAR